MAITTHRTAPPASPIQDALHKRPRTPDGVAIAPAFVAVLLWFRRTAFSQSERDPRLEWHTAGKSDGYPQSCASLLASEDADHARRDEAPD